MGRTGYFVHPDCRLHDMGAGHPECPARIDAIEDRLLITGVADALAGGLLGAALLVMLIVLPLVAPAIIFGAMAVHHAVRGQPVGAELSLLGAMLAVALLVCPLLAAVGLRAAVEA